MGLGVVSALKDDWRGSSQRLQTAGIDVSSSLIPDFRQQPRREPFSSTGQTAEDRAVSMVQKKVFNHLVVEILERTQTMLEGKRVVVISRSNVVGKPLAIMLLQKNATVTICHSHMTSLVTLTRQADVLVAAAGSAEW